MTIMYNNMAGCQRRHKPIKLAIYSNHKIIFNIIILTKKTPKRTQKQTLKRTFAGSQIRKC